jgi:hypothetical protein
MIATYPNACLVFFIVAATLAHAGTKLFSPFRQRMSMNWEHSWFVLADNLEIKDVVKFLFFHAIKWMAIGLAIAVLIV